MIKTRRLTARPASVSPFTRLCYTTLRAPVQFSIFCCINQTVLGKEHLDTLTESGRGFVLAVTHVSHLEPFLVSLHTRRHITWLARTEFYISPFAQLLSALGALKINRTGINTQSLRRAISLAHSGHPVGIFPEGGVQRGPNAIFRGGVAKGGAALIALHAQVPILPAVVLGTQHLNKIKPWLPYRHGHAAIAYGPPIDPPKQISRTTRHALTQTLQSRLTTTYRDLLQATHQQDADIP